MINYYTVLGVGNFASYDDIKTAYRKLSKQWHPDMNGGSAYHAEKFKEIQAAYECLSKPDKRECYDYKLTGFLNGYEAENAAGPQYTYTTYQQPVYQKERTSEWFSPRIFFRVGYIVFLLYQMYTCNSENSSDDFYKVNHFNVVAPAEYHYNKTAQEILDSFARAGRANDSSVIAGSNSLDSGVQPVENTDTH